MTNTTTPTEYEGIDLEQLFEHLCEMHSVVAIARPKVLTWEWMQRFAAQYCVPPKITTPTE